MNRMSRICVPTESTRKTHVITQPHGEKGPVTVARGTFNLAICYRHVPQLQNLQVSVLSL